MISEEYFDLIDKLVDRTRLDEVYWKSTSEDHRFIVYFKNFSLSVFQGFDQNENEEFVRIILLNDDGHEIDSFWISETDIHWKLASDLFSGARRKALNIDKAIHIILNELNSVGKVGKKEAPQKPKSDDGFPF